MTPSSGKSCATDGAEGEDVGGTAVALANSAPAQQHNGADTASEQIAFSIVDMTQAPGIGKTANHDGKWLVAATLATAQLAHRLFVGGHRRPDGIRPGP